MLRNYFKIAWRNLLKNKVFSFINITGLATGLACAFLIYLWVNDELNIDKFHEKDSQLYLVMANHTHTDAIQTIPNVPGLLAPAMKTELPEVENAVHTTGRLENFIISTEDKHINAQGRYAGEAFFDVFSYDLIEGVKDQVFTDKNSIVISESLAKKLFNTTDHIIGKSLEWQSSEKKNEVFISGIFKDVPASASEQFDLLLPFSYFEAEVMPAQYVHWYNYYAYTYLILKKGTNIAAFNAKIKDFVAKRAEGSIVTLFVKPYSENYLYGKYENGVQAGGRIEYVRLFSIIALFILIIACINFMNLSTAKSSRRMKEVGIKKTLGAGRFSLIYQYLGESLLISFLALIIAIVLVEIFLPQFNIITGKNLSLHYNIELILPLLGITILTGLIAGSYPALYLSGFNPVNVLKGKLKASIGELWVRKGLVVFQFCISMILIVAVMIIYKQIAFVQNKHLGFDKDNVINFEMRGQVSDKKETFLTEVKKIPGVINAAETGFKVGGNGWTQGVNWEGKSPNDDYIFEEVITGDNTIETLDITMVAGRSFSNEFGMDSMSIIFNEAAIKTMGLKDPIGKTIRHYTGNKQIVGVMKDFHTNSLHDQIKPLFFLYKPEETTNIIIKLEAGKERETIARLQDFYQKFNPGYAFDYTFLDQDYQALYEAEQRVSTLSKYFAGLAILISCLGLFGLAAFAAEQRSKEISIRKVLGATTTSIVGLLSKDFLKLVFVSLLLASPIAWYLMNKWLENFAYHIEIKWWVFAIAGSAAIFIAFMTIGFQSIKAAVANPVESLKTE
ncbi:MAG: ABC transporter permease [Saprospiraceae bacterium]|nr:ABC transporter permease [Saprospiraceae bacterium]